MTHVPLAVFNKENLLKPNCAHSFMCCHGCIQATIIVLGSCKTLNDLHVQIIYHPALYRNHLLIPFLDKKIISGIYLLSFAKFLCYHDSSSFSFSQTISNHQQVKEKEL